MFNDQYLKHIYERIISNKDVDRPKTEDAMIDHFSRYLDWESWKVKKVEKIYKLQNIEKKGVMNVD